MASRSALTKATRPSATREWLLFGALAILPAVGLGALGLRALRNEEAAIRREASLALASTAQRAVAETNAEISKATDALQHVSFDDTEDRPPALGVFFETAKAITPPSGAAIVVSPSGKLAMPTEGAHASDQHPDRACVDLAQTFRTSSGDALEASKRDIVSKCPEARDDLGRWVWPTLAMDSLGKQPNPALRAQLTAWLADHAASMRASERAATKLDIAALPGLDDDARRAMTDALEGGGGRTDSLALALRSDAAAKAIRGAQGETVTWRGDSSVGVLRPLANGWLVGFVVTPETWTTEIVGDKSFGVGSDMRAAVVRRGVESTPSKGSSKSKSNIGANGSDSSLGKPDDTPESTEWLADGLGIRVTLAHPEAMRARTSRSEALLAMTAIGGGIAAVVLALVLFARVRAARRTSELRTSFVAAVSHELRTPIASIRMLAELLEEDRVEEDERKEVHEALAKEARRLGETVDRLLGFSRMAADKEVTEKRRMRVAAPISAALTRFRERNPDVALEEHLEETLEAEIDPAQIELALDNLLANAKKYAGDGQPYVVRLERANGDALVSVADRGPGIARRDQERIFEAFERVDDRLSKATEGSGIGLSLVAHAARAHGGKAWVESDLGKGSKFIVSIPASPIVEASQKGDNA